MTDGNVTLSIPSAYKHPATHPASMITGLATVATSGKYSDLSGKPSLAKVATSGSYNDLSNRPSIPATPKAYVTSTYHKGSSWYRKWSDGFIEQGGEFSSTSEVSFKTVSLNVSMTTSTYVLLITAKCSGWAARSLMSYESKSTSSFALKPDIFGSDGNQFRGYSWYVCGY